MSDKNVTALKKALGKSRAKKFEDGTVVRFVSTSKMTGFRYSYAAIYIADVNEWYVTGGGNSFIARSVSSKDFIEFLSGDGISDVAVATSWESVDD